MRDVVWRLRHAAKAYEDFTEDTSLYGLFCDAADKIETLQCHVNLLSSKSGIELCRSAKLADLQHRVIELTRRACALEAASDQMKADIEGDGRANNP